MKKIVLITGASMGIGKALAEKMLDKGYYVIGTSRAEEIKGFEKKDFFSIQLDLANSSSIENAQKQIFEKFNRIDILVNNAGIGPDLGTQIPEPKSFNSTFKINVEGAVFFTEPLIDLISESENGIILNVSSKMGSLNECATADSIAYRMSKSALNMYTKILSNRLQNKIKVAAIHPGWVKTTIRESNLIHARLSPEESAEKIFEFLTGKFETGAFWDCEAGTDLLW